METNEEKRVIVYQGHAAPTVAGQVTADTPLESLNLNWRERDLPERVRTKHVHRLHPYLGKFIPQLVEVFLRKYFASGSTVLDPFSGSATTLVQANELGINAAGYDISAFNILLGRVKTAHYDLATLKAETLDALQKTRARVNIHAQPELWAEDGQQVTETEDAYLRDWYAPPVLTQLLTYLAVLRGGGYRYQDVLKVILSRSARSARLTTHFDLDFPKRPQTEPYYCYKHSRTCQPTTDAFQFLRRYSLDTVERIEQYAQVQTDARSVLVHGDSRAAQFPPIDGVITSPPYVGLIDYHEQHAYAYHLLSLDDNRGLEIGAAAEGASQRAKALYKEDIQRVFHNALAAMPSGGPLVIVAHDRANLYDEIGKRLGVIREAEIQRHVNRRTGRRAGEFYESIFIWRKP